MCRYKKKICRGAFYPLAHIFLQLFESQRITPPILHLNNRDTHFLLLKFYKKKCDVGYFFIINYVLLHAQGSVEQYVEINL